MDCVHDAASQKLMNSQLESWRSWNSDEMMGCVASVSEPSRLEVKTPVLICKYKHCNDQKNCQSS